MLLSLAQLLEGLDGNCNLGQYRNSHDPIANVTLHCCFPRPPAIFGFSKYSEQRDLFWFAPSVSSLHFQPIASSCKHGYETFKSVIRTRGSRESTSNEAALGTNTRWHDEALRSDPRPAPHKYTGRSMRGTALKMPVLTTCASNLRMQVYRGEWRWSTD